MNARAEMVAVKQMTRDTFRQAWASGVGAIMLTVTAVCAMLCLSVRVSDDVTLHGGDEPILFLPSSLPPGLASTLMRAPDGGVPSQSDASLARREGVETVAGRVSLAFGAVSFPVSRERRDAVVFLELLLGGGVAGTFGLLLALVWTAGFAPTFLESGVASVLFAKPATRRQLLIGKYLGVLTFVGFQVVLFVGLTWLGLGLSTRVWDRTYWYCVPLLMLQFAVYYSASVLLAVVTRSTSACVVGSVLFWLLGWGINYGCVTARDLPKAQSLPAVTLGLTEAAYWIFPKPVDAGLLLFNALDEQRHFEKPPAFSALERQKRFSAPLSLASTVVLTVALLALSAHELNATDY